MASLSSLVVDLQLESAQLRRGLDEANRKLDSFAKSAERTGNLISGALSFEFLKEAGGALASFIKSGADAADRMGELATSLGVPVEELSKLSYAAEFSGSSTEELGAALGRLSKQMAEALAGSKEQVALFQALGVSVTDASGQLRSSDDVFKDVAQRFSEVADGAAKTALAQELFGKSGAALIPLLNEGAAGLARFGDEAQRTGAVITEEGAEAAQKFNDSLDRLGKASEGLAATVAQDLAGSLAGLAEELTSSSNSTGVLDGAATVLTFTLRTLASAGVLLSTGFEAIAKNLAGIASSALELAKGDLEAAAASWEEMGRALDETAASGRARLAAIWQVQGPGAAMEKDAEKAKPAADKLLGELDRLKKAHEEQEEAAKRAAEARKKAAEAAQREAEEATRAIKAEAKARLGLIGQKELIDRDVSERRARAGGGADPTQGFASFDAALDAMATALKTEADLRAQAAQATRASEAHVMELAADAQRRLADSASRAADAFEELETRVRGEVHDAVSAASANLPGLGPPTSVGKAAEGVGGALASAAAGASPILGDVMGGAAQGAAAGGPFGAIIGAVGGLLANSEGFQGAMDSVSGILQMAADTFGKLFEYLQPLLDVVSIIVENVLASLSPALDALGLVFKGVAWVIAQVVNGIAFVYNGIVDAIAWVVGIFDGGAADKLRKTKMKKVDTDAIFAEKTDDAADKVDKLGDAARDAASAITNVPAWWDLTGARFAAATPGLAAAGGGGGNTTVVNDHSVNETHVHAAPGMDEEALADAVARRHALYRQRRTGNPYGGDVVDVGL